MFRILVPVLFAAVAQDPVRAPSVPADAPKKWVAFSADVRIEMPKRPEAWGRYVQDEHGCVRQDVVHPDGSAIVTITNFQSEQMYRLMKGAWTTQPMRMGTMVRQPYRLRVTRKLEPIEGFDAYLHESNVRSPRGDYTSSETVIPSLNFFRAVITTPSGERRTAVNIRLGEQPHEQFLPPPGALVIERPGYGGYMSLMAVVLRLQFAGLPPVDAVTTEEKAYELKTPSGIPLTLVTSVIDASKNLVRIRVMANATGSPGNVRGDVLDDVQVPLGSTGRTTRLGETLTISVTRVGSATK
jgi:hypothetical protein